jgi:hypothetical protein
VTSQHPLFLPPETSGSSTNLFIRKEAAYYPRLLIEDKNEDAG